LAASGIRPLPAKF